MKLLALIVFLPLSAAALTIFNDHFDINRPALISHDKVTSKDGRAVTITDVSANLGIDIENARIVGPEWVSLICVRNESQSHVVSGSLFFRGTNHSFAQPQDCIRVEQAWLEGQSIRFIVHARHGIVRLRLK